MRGSGQLYILLILGGIIVASFIITGGSIGLRPGTYTAPQTQQATTNNSPTTPPVSTQVSSTPTISTTPTTPPVATNTPTPIPQGTAVGADLVVADFKLTDSTGRVKTRFAVGEAIYPLVTHNNIGTAQALSPVAYVYSQIYDNYPTTAPVGKKSDIGITLRNGQYSVGYRKSYGAAPVGPHRGHYKDNKYSWKRFRPGTFTARAFVNYDNKVPEKNFSNNQRTVTYTIYQPPTPTKKPSPTSPPQGAVNPAPSTNSCGGKYSMNNPMGKNFGDPVCDMTKSNLYDYLKQKDSANADYWYYTVIPCEAPGYNANTYYRCGGAGCTPDPAGAWGLYQMGRGRNGQYDHGDVAWRQQTINAVTYRRNASWRYWACAQSRW